MMYCTVTEFECISYRILGIKFKFSGAKVCVIVGVNEGDEEMERFWKDLDRVLDSLSYDYIIYIMRDLNSWVYGEG